jgi:hypothetical protein
VTVAPSGTCMPLTKLCITSVPHPRVPL